MVYGGDMGQGRLVGIGIWYGYLAEKNYIAATQIRLQEQLSLGITDLNLIVIN